MDGQQIESLLFHASAKTARAHQRITKQLDFCWAGVKNDEETGEFLLELECARYELEAVLVRLLEIRQMYSEARSNARRPAKLASTVNSTSPDGQEQGKGGN